MEFDGSFELEDIPPAQAWIVLSDPVAVRNALRGCRFITPMDEDFSWDDYEPPADVETLPDADPAVVAERAFREGQEYAALMQIGVGSVKPRFETVVTIEDRDDEAFEMVASGGGSASDSRFTMTSGMTIEPLEEESGSRIEWWVEADISGRIAQLGSRVIKPVADKIVGDFFSEIESQMGDVEETDSGFTERIRGMF